MRDGGPIFDHQHTLVRQQFGFIYGNFEVGSADIGSGIERSSPSANFQDVARQGCVGLTDDQNIRAPEIHFPRKIFNLVPRTKCIDNNDIEVGPNK